MRLATYNGEPLPVFPCYTNKRPACANGFKDASADPARIAALWRGRSGLLVAVPTGEASGIAVLDIDRPWDGETALPATRRHQTRSGGRHHVFRHRPGLRCSQGVIAPGVDVRADGGYVIWWPAHRLCFEDRPLADWPEWLAPVRHAMVEREHGAPWIDNPTGERAPPPASGGTQNLIARAGGILAKVETAPVGTRNARLFWAACRFAEIVAEGAIRRGVAEQLLEGAARQCGLARDDGLGAVRATIASGLSPRNEGRGPLFR